ncbi:MAG: NAD(P)/FAD-dependent oxidoreductase [Lautropia sp.]
MRSGSTNTYDVIVIGAGVIGASVAFHLGRLGAGRVLVLERDQIGTGTTSQSSGILRTHYSVPQNVELALRSWKVFNAFKASLEDDEAECGLVRCGYLIAAPEGDKASALRAVLDSQRAAGIAAEVVDRRAAEALLPIASFASDALIGFEPEAGFADAWLVTTSFARAARRLGVQFREGVDVRSLRIADGVVTGVDTTQGRFEAGTVVSTQNIWARDIERWTGIATPVIAERHVVLALEGPRPYSQRMPVFKDLASEGMLYCRSYGGTQMLVSEGLAGEVLDPPSNEPGEVTLDTVATVGAQVAARFPAFDDAGLASSWTGVYDVTPDWNPVLGRLDGLDGLVVGYGFSGHGFKLSPAVGCVLAQAALGLQTDVSLAPYAHSRFGGGTLLRGRYGVGAVS